MCLTTARFKSAYRLNKALQKPQVAETDLLVYKRLKRGSYSPYQGTKYAKGLHTANMKATRVGMAIEVNAGLHAYVDLKYATGRCNSSDKVVSMVIPRGSKYYISGNGQEIVANNLLWR